MRGQAERSNLLRTGSIRYLGYNSAHPSKSENLSLLSVALPSIDRASIYRDTPIPSRPMISTVGHRTCINKRLVWVCRMCTYAARRWTTEASVDVSFGSSILPFGFSGDSFGLEYNIPTHSKTVATIARKPITIPQYTHDISHSLACESRESFLRMTLRRHAIHPLGLLVFHLGKCFGFSAPSG